MLFVEGSNGRGCTTLDSFRVSALDRPRIVVSGGADLCCGGSTPLQATGASSYRWTPEAGLSCFDCADPVASPIASAIYTVVGTLPGGCSDTANVTVDVAEPELVTARLERGVTHLEAPVGD